MKKKLKVVGIAILVLFVIGAIASNMDKDDDQVIDAGKEAERFSDDKGEVEVNVDNVDIGVRIEGVVLCLKEAYKDTAIVDVDKNTLEFSLSLIDSTIVVGANLAKCGISEYVSLWNDLVNSLCRVSLDIESLVPGSTLHLIDPVENLTLLTIVNGVVSYDYVKDK